MKMRPWSRSSRLGTAGCLAALALCGGCRAMSESVMDPSVGLNGGFEVVEAGLPVNWLVYTPRTLARGDYDVVVDTLRYRAGSRSLMFRVRECSAAGGNRSPGISREYEARGGDAYTLGFWVRNDGAEFRVRMGGVSAKTGDLETVVQTGESIPEWRYYEHRYVLPPGLQRLRLEVNVLSPGTFWIDEIRIDGLETEPPELAFEIHRVDVGFESADVRVVDWDGDGHLDLLVSGGESIVRLAGDGTGQLEVRGRVAAGEHPVAMALGDLDEDGRTDIVVANHETDYLTLIMGGAGELGSSRGQRLAVDVSPHPHAVAVADVDGDGHLDIVVDDRGRERLQVHVGAGDGSFRVGEAIGVGGDPYRGMTVADVTGDGRLDVVTPNPRAVAVQVGDGQGGFLPGVELASRDMPPFSTGVGDFNGDGVLDIAAGSGESRGGVRVWWGREGGGYAPAPGSPYRIADGPTAMRVADVNGDGVDDIVVASYVGNGLAVVLGGDPPAVIRIDLEDNPWNVDVGDLDEDGRLDVVTTNDSGSRITVLLQRPGG